MSIEPLLPSSPALEAAIAANPDDDDAWSVYADWLQMQGHPLGEHISLELSQGNASAPDLDLDLEQFEHHLGSDLVDSLRTHGLDPNLELTWKCGFVVDVHLRSLAGQRRGPAPLEVVHQLLTAPAGRFLRRIELALGLDPWPNPIEDIRKGREAAWADVAIWASFTVGGVEQRMRWLEPGTFIVGPNPGEPPMKYRSTPHQVTLTQGFWLAETPCTQGLWTAVMGRNPSYFIGSLHCPVEGVAWDDIQGFLERLNKMGRVGFQLPTEAQWEYACRAGTTMVTRAELGEIAWYWDNSLDPSKVGTQPYRRTHDVKLKKPNAWGLYDMLGNVDEWCADEVRRYTAEPAVDPVGSTAPTTLCRAIRGGNWRAKSDCMHFAHRIGTSRDAGSRTIGFRLARGSGRERHHSSSE